MTEGIELISKTIPNQEEANKLLERLISVASPSSVFSDPVEAGEYKVITASEARVGLGFGFGGGGGSEPPSEDQERSQTMGVGGGGGGGGTALGRPVAAIEIGPQGVRVEPIVDPTKIAIAFFTTMVSMIAMFGRMRRASGR